MSTIGQSLGSVELTLLREGRGPSVAAVELEGGREVSLEDSRVRWKDQPRLPEEMMEGATPSVDADQVRRHRSCSLTKRTFSTVQLFRSAIVARPSRSLFAPFFGQFPGITGEVKDIQQYSQMMKRVLSRARFDWRSPQLLGIEIPNVSSFVVFNCFGLVWIISFYGSQKKIGTSSGSLRISSSGKEFRKHLRYHAGMSSGALRSIPEK
jgi:hypothetical protein